MDEKYIARKMKKGDIGRKITYRNDFFGEGTIKEVVVVGVDERYPFFGKVVNYPVNRENLDKHWVWFSKFQGKEKKENIKKSGDWYVNGIISEIEKLKLNGMLKKK